MLEIEPGSVVVRRGALVAPLPVLGRSVSPRALKGVVVEDDGGRSGAAGLRGRLIVTIEDSCDQKHEVSLTLANLNARIENVAALALYRQRKWADAADGFARALALDSGAGRRGDQPGLGTGARRQARRRGAHAGAAAGEGAGRDLRARRVGSGPRAPAADAGGGGSARAGARNGAPGAHEARGHLAGQVARRRHGPRRRRRLAQVPAGRGGRRRMELGHLHRAGGISLPRLRRRGGGTPAPLLLRGDDHRRRRQLPVSARGQGEIGARVAAAQRLLAISASRRPPARRGTSPPARRATRGRYSRAPSSASSSAATGIRALRGDDELGATANPGAEQIRAATHLADANVVFLRWGRGGREGCEGSDPAGRPDVRDRAEQLAGAALVVPRSGLPDRRGRRLVVGAFDGIPRGAVPRWASSGGVLGRAHSAAMNAPCVLARAHPAHRGRRRYSVKPS